MIPLDQKPHLNSLTSLRGIGALWIVSCHMAISVPYFNVCLLRVFSYGVLAVDFFFILSGFVITYSYLPQFVGAFSLKNFTRFLQTRFLRIYPVAFFVLVFVWLPTFLSLSMAGIAIDPEIMSMRSFFLQLFLLNGIGLPHSQGGWNGPTWALSSELVLYWCFPLVARLVNAHKSFLAPLACMAGIIALLIMLSVIITGGNHFMIGEQFTLVRAGSEFLLGALLCRVFTLAPNKHIFVTFAGWGSLVAIPLVAVLNLHPFYLFIFLILFCICIYSFAQPNNYTKKILENTILIRLGHLSYSIYVIHYFILSINRSIIKKVVHVDSLMVNILFALVSIVCILVAASYLYKLEEYIRRSFTKKETIKYT